MAKAKKPASTGGEANDISKAEQVKPAGAVPKTTRSKTNANKPAVPKKSATPLTEKTAVTSESSTPQSEKASDVLPTTETTIPLKTETPERDSVKKAETKEPAPAAMSKPLEPVTPDPEKGGSIFWSLLIGGALAAALGFLASEMNLLGTRSETSDLRATMSKQQMQIAELMSAEPEVANVEFPELDGLTSELAKLSETVAAMEKRLNDVEKRPIASGSSDAPTIDTSAYEREVEALRASVQEQRSEIESLLNNALSVEEATAKAARNATLQGAMTRITAAINSGKPYTSALAELTANGISDIPAELSDVADSGVVTLINLQTRFPDNARAALSDARVAGSDGAEGGVGGFLRRQLGARSVTPREGTDPDAVLSRAEAAVRDGRLTDALAELDTLPEPSQNAMRDWIADARARQAAEASIEDLSQRLTAN